MNEYWDYVTRTLDNPQSLWEHFFEQLSQDCRDMVYLVVLNGRSISEHNLLRAFRRLRDREKHRTGATEDQARVALKICTGSVLNRNISTKTDAVRYDLYNPSIADYVIGRLSTWNSYAHYVLALETIASLGTLSTMRAREVITVTQFNEILDGLVANAQAFPIDEYSIRLSDLLLTNDTSAGKHQQYLQKQIEGLDVAAFSGSDALLLTDRCAMKFNYRM